MKIVSSVTFNDEYKVLKTESRIMVKSLRTLRMQLFLGFSEILSKCILVMY